MSRWSCGHVEMVSPFGKCANFVWRQPVGLGANKRSVNKQWRTGDSVVGAAPIFLSNKISQ